MSTHASIGIYDSIHNKSTFIYCHNDGYLEHVGVILLLYYNTPEKAQALIDLGDISALHANLAPLIGEEDKHSFDHRLPNVTVAYHRDRGEDFHQIEIKGKRAKEIWDRCETSYQYLYKDNAWYYTATGTRWSELASSKIVRDIIAKKG